MFSYGFPKNLAKLLQKANSRYNFGIFAGKRKRRYFKYFQFITEELFKNTNIILTTHKLNKHLNQSRLGI